jgi:hypothetical protein
MIFKLRKGKGKEEAANYIYCLDDRESWDVKVTKKRWKRSISQNNLYWLWLTCIEQETGNDRHDLHEFFKAKFLGFEEITVLDHLVTRVVSTTQKNTLQFKEYLDKIQLFASVELGIELPDPESKYWNEFYETYKYLL